MSDVRQKTRDLLKLACDEGTSSNERLVAARSADALVEKYKLLSGEPVNVPASVITEILNKVIDGTFMDQVADRVEKTASAVERMIAAGKRIAEVRGPATKKKRRTYR